MVNTANTNPGALIALQNHTRITGRLEDAQRRVSTGLEVSTEQDYPALFALAQQQRAELGSIKSVQQGLRVGISTVDAALAAGESISEVLVGMRALASQAADPSLNAADLAVVSDQYIELRDHLTRLVDTAEFGGRNLLASGAGNMTLVAGPDGATSITVNAQDLSVGGANVTVSPSATPFAATPDDPVMSGGDESKTSSEVAQAELTAIEASIANVSTALGALGGGSNSLDLQNRILMRVSNALEISIGNLVDADLARERSSLQALQVQQQLAIQTLSITNTPPNTILALFA